MGNKPGGEGRSGGEAGRRTVSDGRHSEKEKKKTVQRLGRKIHWSPALVKTCLWPGNKYVRNWQKHTNYSILEN